jgi:phenylalanyl-tRNA synthetase beta chain
MKVSLSWLSDYVTISMGVDRLADALTMAGLEVDAVWDRYETLKTVLVGRIDAVHPHPHADRLQICDVNAGQRMFRVVCGAPNVRPRMLSPLALPGTHMADGSVIEKGTIRGVVSDGMLCSEAELGLGPDRSGIMALDPSLTVGTPLNSALKLSDPVLEIDLTPNRPDCLSVMGIAREIAAIEKVPLVYPDIACDPHEGDITEFTSVRIEAPRHCPRYAAQLLTGVSVGPSPPWLQDRLLSVGLRPINNIVDVTNFVLMETGQPLHAFDFDRLEEQRIVVRTARKAEQFVTLDGKSHQLTEDMLMICDGRKPVAIGGVMGGRNSEIVDATHRVLIESAYFNPLSIRKTSKRLKLFTDASHRFERGVDPDGQVRAMNRAAQLMVQVSGARLIAGIIDENPIAWEPVTVNLTVSATNRLLGTRHAGDHISNYLTSIGFQVTARDDEHLEVGVPSFRVDVSRGVDLAEEVARLAGYGNILQDFPLIPAQSRHPDRRRELRDAIKALLLGFGYSETINYSFSSRQAADALRLAAADPRRTVVEIRNPLSEEQAVMRSSLLPGLLDTVRRNITRGEKSLKLFESGRIFIANGTGVLPSEIEMLCGVVTGAHPEAAWHSPARSSDFYDAKGAVEALLTALHTTGAAYTRMPADQCTYTCPGRTAEIVITDRVIGLVGEVHPRVLERFDIAQPVFVFEIDTQDLVDHIPEEITSHPIPRFPAVTRDITLIIDRSIEAQTVIDAVGAMEEDWIESVSLFDIFEGPPVPEGKKSISFRIVYRSLEHTLEDEPVNRLHRRIGETLVDTFKAELPG